jgi:hypothetical protein
MAVFGYRAFKEASKTKQGHLNRSESNMPGVLIRRDKDSDKHRLMEDYRRTQHKVVIHKPERKDSEDSKPANTLILDSLHSRTMRRETSAD